MRNAGRTSKQAALEPGKTTSVKPGENLQMEGGGGHTISHCRSARSLLWNCLQESSPALPSGDGAGEALRSLKGAVAWGGWKGRFSFLPPWKGHREHGEAGETMHLKPKNKTIFSVCLHLRIQPGGNWIPGQSEVVRVVYKPVLSPPACAGKKHFLTETLTEPSLCEHCKYFYMKQLI